MQIIDFLLFSKKAILKNNVFFLVLALFSAINLFGHEENSHSTAENHNSKEVITNHVDAHTEVDKPIGKKVSEMMLGHIGDNHYWDAFGHYVMIPLPCIIYTKSNGLQFFSASKFNHGHSEYNGLKLTNSGAKIAWADASNTEKILNFSITKNVATLFLASIILVVVLIQLAKKYAKRLGKAPKGFQNGFESILLFIRDEVIKPSVGKDWIKHAPILLTIFFFILLLNLMGQIPFFPGGANVSGNIAVAMVLAVVVFIYVNVNGNKSYWKHIFMPDVPKLMYIILIPIEILGVFLKPLVLMLRLFANITAGHIIILGFFSLIFIFGSMKEWVGYAVSPASIAFSIFMSFMELLVAFLQAFVFTLLSSLYIGMATEEHHSSDAHH